MEAAPVPVLAYVVFAAAFGSGLMFFGCLFVITRRLGMTFQQRFGSWTLQADDQTRMMKLLLGRERDAKVDTLLWIVRACWAATFLLVITFAALVAGII